jgi:hypothetical protein
MFVIAEVGRMHEPMRVARKLTCLPHRPQMLPADTNTLTRLKRAGRPPQLIMISGPRRGGRRDRAMGASAKNAGNAGAVNCRRP